jgi:hypothetical protein
MLGVGSRMQRAKLIHDLIHHAPPYCYRPLDNLPTGPQYPRQRTRPVVPRQETGPSSATGNHRLDQATTLTARG